MGNMKKGSLLGIAVGFIVLSMPLWAFSYTVTLEEFTGDDASVTVEITGDGTNSITFDITVVDPIYADITGFWFNFDPFPSPNDVVVTGTQVAEYSVVDDAADLDVNYADLNGGGNLYTVWDAGIAIGFSGGANDGGNADYFHSTTFTVSNSTSLTLGGLFGARLQSVGDLLDGEEYPDGSSKLVGNSAPVPEPATMLLFGTGLAGLAGISRRRKK